MVLDITAQQGAGSLLCAVAGVFQGTGGTGGALNGLVALLNRILSIL
ncbi:hypothetical protein ACL02O_15520 [Micromonospora sp. MS34]